MKTSICRVGGEKELDLCGNPSVTASPCHLPLHKGGEAWVVACGTLWHGCVGFRRFFQCGLWPHERKAGDNAFSGKKVCLARVPPRPPCVKGAVRVSGLGECRATQAAAFLSHTFPRPPISLPLYHVPKKPTTSACRTPSSVLSYDWEISAKGGLACPFWQNPCPRRRRG